MLPPPAVSQKCIGQPHRPPRLSDQQNLHLSSRNTPMLRTRTSLTHHESHHLRLRMYLNPSNIPASWQLAGSGVFSSTLCYASVMTISFKISAEGDGRQQKSRQLYTRLILYHHDDNAYTLFLRRRADENAPLPLTCHHQQQPSLLQRLATAHRQDRCLHSAIGHLPPANHQNIPPTSSTSSALDQNPNTSPSTPLTTHPHTRLSLSSRPSPSLQTSHRDRAEIGVFPPPFPVSPALTIQRHTRNLRE